MATVYGIEVAGDTYDIEDTQARQSVQSVNETATEADGKADDNATAISAINAKIPSSASESNKLVPESGLGDYAKFYKINETVPTDKNIAMHNSPTTGWLLQMEVSLQNQTPLGAFTNAKRIMFGIDAIGGIYVIGSDANGTVVATKRINWDS